MQQSLPLTPLSDNMCACLSSEGGCLALTREFLRNTLLVCDYYCLVSRSHRRAMCFGYFLVSKQAAPLHVFIWVTG